jgi:hypothetical protein
MEGVVVMDRAVYSGDEGDVQLMVMLRTLIALILHESREENDYRHIKTTTGKKSVKSPQ